MNHEMIIAMIEDDLGHARLIEKTSGAQESKTKSCRLRMGRVRPRSCLVQMAQVSSIRAARC